MSIEILVVDDEAPLREISKRTLIQKGYFVQTAENGKEALKLIEQGYRPGLVVTDRQMPRMGGEDLARNLRKLLPELPIIMVTGAYEESLHNNPNLDYVLEKPYSPSLLVELVGNLLKAESSV